MADYNSSLPIRTETNGDAAVKVVDGTVTSQALGIDSTGRVTIKNQDGAGNALASSTTTPAGTEQALIVRNIPSGTQTVSGTVAATQSGTWSTRTQDGSGNNTTSSAAGATRPLDVSLRDASGNLYGSAAAPLNVSFSYDPAGNEINNYLVSTAIAVNATSNHDYTVTAAKTLQLKQVEATCSGKSKIEVQVESGIGTGTYTTRVVQFNSTANPNMSIHFDDPVSVAAGVKVRVIRTNLDKSALDVYSTIMGQEV